MGPGDWHVGDLIDNVWFNLQMAIKAFSWEVYICIYIMMNCTDKSGCIIVYFLLAERRRKEYSHICSSPHFSYSKVEAIDHFS